MSGKEREEQNLLQDVDPSKLGQLSPGYTPYNPELQSWNRGRSLSRGGDNYQAGRASGQPEFTALESEDLSAVAKEYAVHLDQIELDLIDNEKLSNREQGVVQVQAEGINQQQEQKEQEAVQEVKQEIVKQEISDSGKLDKREPEANQQKTDTPNQNREKKENEVTQELNQEQQKEQDHER